MDYDVLVIGAGTAGKNAAKAARTLGTRTAIAEVNGFAGLCLTRG